MSRVAWDFGPSGLCGLAGFNCDAPGGTQFTVDIQTVHNGNGDPTPMPEPSSIMLFGAGLGMLGLMVMTRRRRRSMQLKAA